MDECGYLCCGIFGPVFTPLPFPRPIIVSRMAEKAPCSCGCGKLVSASTDHRHRAGKTTPRAKATSLTTTNKSHPSSKNFPPRKRQKTNPDPPAPLKIQDRGAIHASGSSVNDVPRTANMAVDMEGLNPPLPPLSPNNSEIEVIEPVVNLCAEAWTNASRYRATVEDADSDEESDGEEDGRPSSESEDGEGVTRLTCEAS